MKHFLVPFLLLACMIPVKAQQISEELNLADSSQLHVLETKRGDRFIGRVIKIENTTVYFNFRADQ